MANEHKRVYFSATQNLATGALSETITFKEDFIVEHVYVTFSSNVTQTLTKTIIPAGPGSSYNTIFSTTSLSSASDHGDATKRKFLKGDGLKIDVGNSGTPAVNAFLYVTGRPA